MKKTVQTCPLVILSNIVAEWYPQAELHQMIENHHYGITGKEVVNWLLVLLGLAGQGVPLENILVDTLVLLVITAGQDRALTMRRLLHSPGLFIV